METAKELVIPVTDLEATPMANRLSLCGLPCEIRQLIYDQLFPHHNQLYLMASQEDLQLIKPAEEVPTSLLLVNRQLNDEACHYMYNRYLFNIVGLTKHCLLRYPAFESVLQKYYTQPVRIDGFGNGEHSATCCLSLQPGSRHLDVLNRRRRGKPKTLNELRESVVNGGEDFEIRTRNSFLGRLVAW